MPFSASACSCRVCAIEPIFIIDTSRLLRTSALRNKLRMAFSELSGPAAHGRPRVLVWL